MTKFLFRWVFLLTLMLPFTASRSELAQQSLSLETLNAATEGQATVLHFWATWCAPCVEELADIEHFKASLSEQEAARFYVISMDKVSPQRVREFLLEHALNVDTAQADDVAAFAKAFDLSFVPITLLRAPDAEIIERFEQPIDWSDSQPARAVRKHLSPAKPLPQR